MTHEDLLIRCENCQQILQKFHSFYAEKIHIVASINKLINIQRAEYVMLQQALQSESIANTEELLGHFGK